MHKLLSRLETLRSKYSALINWLVVAMVFASSASSSVPTKAQTFLEKLESAVRQRLNDAQPAQNQAAANSLGAAKEELPAPQPNRSPNASGQTGNEVPSPLRSVLEDQPGAKVPAIGTVPPLVLESGKANSVPTDRRIYLGLEAEELTGGGIGVQVTNVMQDSPAWKAGFKPSDRIMGINGFAIANLDNMVQQLGKTAPGETVRFLVSRNERNIELVAVLMEAGLAERIAGSALRIGELNDAAGDGPAWMGVMVSDLTPAFRNQFGLTIFRGAAVTSVSANSPAAAIGIMAGDAIVSVGGLAIETSAELMNWTLTARPGEEVDIAYHRGSVARTSRLTLQVNPESQTARRAKRTATTDAQRPISPNSSRYNVVPAPPVPQSRLGDNQSQASTPPSIQANSPSAPLIPNPIPNPLTNPSNVGVQGVEVAELQREIASLKSQLEKANQRLETTQQRLKQILEGLGNK